MRRAPGPLCLLGLVAIAIAFSTDHPLVLGAVAIGAVVLFMAAPGRPSRLFLLGGALSGITLAILNPFVSSQGDLILWHGPDVPIIDLEITLEEVVAGIAIGVRLFAVAVIVGALLAHMDADRLQAQVSRIAPRSALTCALAARLMPTLQRDARSIVETARLRGVALVDGSWSQRARHSAPLALPLLGSSLARGLDVAEAMTARGYGAGARTRIPEARYDRVERAVLVIAVALCLVAVAAIGLGAVGYSYYPTLATPFSAGPVAVAAATLAALVGAAAVLRR